MNGGLILFENPPSSLTFHDPLMKSWLRSVAPYISQVAACSHGLHLRKRWAFACNKPEIMSLASVCEHAADYHEFHLGERLPDGTFYSRLTAEYPPSLACALAAIIRPYVTAQVTAFHSSLGEASSLFALLSHAFHIELRMGQASIALLLGFAPKWPTFSVPCARHGCADFQTLLCV